MVYDVAKLASLSKHVPGMVGYDEISVGDGDFGILEHLIHEVSHAASLNILPFNAGTSGKIECILGNSDSTIEEDFGVIEETVAWAVEWLVWIEFGLDEIFSWGDLNSAAGAQGCRVSDIKDLVDPENSESDHIYDLSRIVIAEVLRLTGKVKLK